MESGVAKILGRRDLGAMDAKMTKLECVIDICVSIAIPKPSHNVSNSYITMHTFHAHPLQKEPHISETLHFE